MVADTEGFVYPQTDDTRCIECGLCEDICAFRRAEENIFDGFKVKVYAARHRDIGVRMCSSSGGVFTALSSQILSNGGAVYGAAFGEDFEVRHEKAESADVIDRLRGSKYVQSALNDVFPDVRATLKRGIPVLFAGTPCQTAGLNAYLGYGRHEKLVLCDVVCHGVGSPLIWREYKSLLVRIKKSKLKSFNFRDKTNGWHRSSSRAFFENGVSLHGDPLVDVFDSLFYQHVALRPSCHVCVFKSVRRPSDITIGDFWGIESAKPNFDDNLGVSLVLINTRRGEVVFESARKALFCVPCDIDECRSRTLSRADAAPSKRKSFWEDYYRHGFENVARRYSDYGFVNLVRHRVMRPFLSKLGIMRAARHATI